METYCRHMRTLTFAYEHVQRFQRGCGKKKVTVLRHNAAHLHHIQRKGNSNTSHTLNTHWLHSFVLQLSDLTRMSKRRYTAFVHTHTHTHTHTCGKNWAAWNFAQQTEHLQGDEPTLSGQELYSTIGLVSIETALNHKWTKGQKPAVN